jgi:hypothetical protein
MRWTVTKLGREKRECIHEESTRTGRININKNHNRSCTSQGATKAIEQKVRRDVVSKPQLRPIVICYDRQNLMRCRQQAL